LPMDITAARYLEYMVHGFFNGLIALLNSEGLSDDDRETVYALGYNYFTYGKYEAARDTFTGLVAYAPGNAFYWRALGAVNQQMTNYPEAIEAYDKAITHDDKDIISYVYRAESQILSGNLQTALKDLEKVLEFESSPQPEHTPWVKRAKLLLERHGRDSGEQRTD